MLGSAILEQGSAGNGFPRNLVQHCVKKDIYFLIDLPRQIFSPERFSPMGRAPGPSRLTGSTHFEDPGTDRVGRRGGETPGDPAADHASRCGPVDGIGARVDDRKS